MEGTRKGKIADEGWRISIARLMAIVAFVALGLAVDVPYLRQKGPAIGITRGLSEVLLGWVLLILPAWFFVDSWLRSRQEGEPHFLAKAVQSLELLIALAAVVGLAILMLLILRG